MAYISTASWRFLTLTVGPIINTILQVARLATKEAPLNQVAIVVV
jgi:hypothetical protein